MLDVLSLKPMATVKMRDINALNIEAQVVGKLLSDLEEQRRFHKRGYAREYVNMAQENTKILMKTGRIKGNSLTKICSHNNESCYRCFGYGHGQWDYKELRNMHPMRRPRIQVFPRTRMKPVH